MRPERVNAEAVAVAMVVKGVEDHLEDVVTFHVVVTPKLRRHNACGIGVIANDRQIEVELIEQNPDFCSFRTRGALLRVALQKFSYGSC